MLSGNLLNTASTVTCPHGAQARPSPGRHRVLAQGSPAVTTADLFTVTGCPATAAGGPGPCTSVRWTGPSARVRIDGSPAVLQSSPGACHSAGQSPQGPAVVSVVQQRVVGA
ncbi:hypothetical protein C0036_04455 [Streptomyces sp. DJ]|nr:hypothetical protein C0036_04455 [Streptomyces sp. DJ]